MCLLVQYMSLAAARVKGRQFSSEWRCIGSAYTANAVLVADLYTYTVNNAVLLMNLYKRKQ